MATTPEGKVKRQVKKILKERGVWYVMPVPTGYGMAGVPDFLCCWRGLFLAIETKAPGKKYTLTANQKNKISAIRQAGGVAVVIDDPGELEELFDRWESDLSNSNGWSSCQQTASVSSSRRRGSST